MPVKIEVNKSLQSLIDVKARRGLLPRVREEFSKKGPIKIKQAIVKDMTDGISPVKGKRWGKYSDSYKAAIKGKPVKHPTTGELGIWRKKGGKTIFIKTSKLKGPTQVQKDANPVKAISPVNLRLSGTLHKSLFARTVGGFIKNPYTLIVGFNNYLADIHNRRGAGKSKVKRRLLPTRSGESFNRNITDTIVKELKKAADKVAKQFSGQ